jgi:pimeloyl-ACP methyl ester carboxylesterase
MDVLETRWRRVWGLSLALLCCTGLLRAQTNCDNTSVPTLTPPGGLVEPETLLRESACTPGKMGTRTPLILIHGLGGSTSIPPTSSDLTVFENLSLYLTQQDPSFSQNYKIFTYHYLSDEYTVSQIGAALEAWLDYFRQSWDPYSEGDKPFDRDVVLIGHSMGGLVVRALMNENTISSGAKAGQPAGERVIRALTLAGPHHGTALVNSTTLRLHGQSEPSWEAVLTALDLGWAVNCPDCVTDIDLPNRGDLLCDTYYANDIFSSTLSLYAGSDVDIWLNALPSTYNNKVNAYYGILGSYGGVPTYGAEDALTIEVTMGQLAITLGAESLQPSNTGGLTSSELATFHELMQLVSIILERIDLDNWSGDLTTVSNDGAVPDFSASFAGATVAKRVSCVTSDHADMLEGTGGSCRDQTTGLTGTLFPVLDADLESLAPSATGTGAQANLSPTSLSFSSQGLGTTSAAATVTLSNPGNVALSITSIAIAGTNAGDFAQSNTCGSSVAAGRNCTVNVTFTPTATGTRNATLSFMDNAANSPQTISLTGAGVNSPGFSLSVSPGSATVTAGGSATYTLSVNPAGGFNQQVSLSCTGAPSTATCSVSPASVSLDGTNAAKATVKVTTTAGSLASPRRRLVPPGPVGPLAILCAMWLLMLATLSSMATVRRQRVRLSLAVLAATALLTISWVACGGGAATTPAPSGTPAGTYTLTLTGTYTGSSGSLTNNTTVSLTVN